MLQTDKKQEEGRKEGGGGGGGGGEEEKERERENYVAYRQLIKERISMVNN